MKLWEQVFGSQKKEGDFNWTDVYKVGDRLEKPEKQPIVRFANEHPVWAFLFVLVIVAYFVVLVTHHKELFTSYHAKAVAEYSYAHQRGYMSIKGEI